MAGNKSLNRAAKVKQDEFYTRMEDIEEELRPYRRQFKDKTILCNCDDPYESNFFKYFVLNFNKLHLKKLIATCYSGSWLVGKQLSLFDVLETVSGTGHAYKAIVTSVRDTDGDGIDMDDIRELFITGENVIEELDGDGSYDSPECLELLDEADIVVTNPPFSLFIEYINMLVEHDKKFLILGNQNNVSYKDVFKLFMADRVWMGYHAGDMSFRVPDYYEPRKTRFWVDEDGQKWRSFGNMCWYTNLDVKRRHETMILVRRYDPSRYQAYDNYDAIDVDHVTEIPCDYAGVMGVPLTFLYKYNPEQFELIGITDRNNPYGITTRIYTRDDGPNYSDLNRRGALRQADGTLKSTYVRVLIRNKNPEVK